MPTSRIASFFSEDLNYWINLNMTNNMDWNCMESWDAFWATAYHSLWHWHNKEIHEEGFSRPLFPSTHIINTLQDYKKAHNVSSIVMNQNRILNLNQWEPPQTVGSSLIQMALEIEKVIWTVGV